MEDYISHIGNENSGRYPRGSGKNPYQRDPRRRKSSGLFKKKAASSSGSKSKQKPYKKMTTEELMKTRSAKKVYEHRFDFSEQELKQWMSRIDTEKKLKKLSDDEKFDANKFMKTILNYGTTMNEAYELIGSPLGQAIQKKMGINSPVKVEKSGKSKKK